MGGSYVGDAVVSLLTILFDLYILAVMLRFLLQWVRADFYNPISQFLVRITNPPLRFLRRFIPGWGGIDLASVVLLLALESLKLWLVLSISARFPPLTGLLILSIADLLTLAIHVFLFSILIQVIISWVNPGLYSPATYLLYRLNEPLLTPARRLIPPFAGLDLSPLVVLIFLRVIVYKLVAVPLTDLGRNLLS
jgi:YggT family protein